MKKFFNRLALLALFAQRNNDAALDGIFACTSFGTFALSILGSAQSAIKVHLKKCCKHPKTKGSAQSVKSASVLNNNRLEL
jgi:hypothetical protein